MSNYNWCHGPQCHENHTQDRIRGVKGNKVLRTRKIAVNRWNENSFYKYFCSTQCYNDFANKHVEQVIAIAPCNEPKETPIEVEVVTETNWRGEPYKTKVIKSIDNQDQSAVGLS